MTKLWKSTLLTLLVGGATWFAPVAKADEWDKQTVLTFNEPVEVPGKVLPAGNYEFVLVRSDSSRNLVQIFNADGTELYATVQTIPVERARETKAMLESAVDLIVPFTIETAELYAQIRGSMNVPPADAIHLASAAQARADLFLTNDDRLVGKFVPGIQFIASLQAPLF